MEYLVRRIYFIICVLLYIYRTHKNMHTRMLYKPYFIRLYLHKTNTQRRCLWVEYNEVKMFQVFAVDTCSSYETVLCAIRCKVGIIYLYSFYAFHFLLVLCHFTFSPGCDIKDGLSMDAWVDTESGFAVHILIWIGHRAEVKKILSARNQIRWNIFK